MSQPDDTTTSTDRSLIALDDIRAWIPDSLIDGWESIKLSLRKLSDLEERSDGGPGVGGDPPSVSSEEIAEEKTLYKGGAVKVDGAWMTPHEADVAITLRTSKEAAAWGLTAVDIAGQYWPRESPTAERIARISVDLALAARRAAESEPPKYPTIPEMCRQVRKMREAIDLLRAEGLEADATRDQILTERAG